MSIYLNHVTNSITASSGNLLINGFVPQPTSAILTSVAGLGTTGSGYIKVVNGVASLDTTGSLSTSSATKTLANKTAAYTIVAGDSGKVINCTGGSFTVALTAAATLGAGFTCTIWNTSNTSTDAIVVDPNASETIDGVAAITLRRGEGFSIVCDGTNWYTDNKKPMRSYTENLSISDYPRPSATGANSIAIGSFSTASGSTSFSAGGYQARADANNSIAIGNRTLTTSGATLSSAIGANSSSSGSVTATGLGAMALGGSYASGTDSFAAATTNNTSAYGATAANSIAIGQSSIASAANSVAINSNSIASGIFSIALNSGTASGDNSFALGSSSIASGSYSIAMGSSSKASQVGKYAFASSMLTYNGDSQFGKMVLQATTTTNTSAILTSNGSTATSTNQLILTTNQAMMFFGTLIAKQTASANMAAYIVKGAVVNNSGTVSISALSVETFIDTIGLTTQPTFTVDNVNKALAITSGNKLSTSIRWVCNLDSAEVIYT